MGVPTKTIGEVARMQTMLLDSTRATGGAIVLYKRDRSNAYGTVDLGEGALLLRRLAWSRLKGQRFHRQVQWARIITVTGVGSTRVWRF